MLASTLALIMSLSLAVAQPPPDPERGELRIVVFGDFNGPYGSVEYAASVGKTMTAITEVWKPDLFLSPGDVIAGQDRSLPDDRFPLMWAAFDAVVAEPLRSARIPYAVALGNHDASSLRGADGTYLFQRERRAALAYWSGAMYNDNLEYLDRANHPFYFTFSFHGVFMVVLDASSASLGDQQEVWLSRTLGSSTAKSSSLRVVIGHLPLYPVSQGREGQGESVSSPELLRHTFESASVDLYISGHHAAYYPGRVGNLELLFAGGVGARKLLVGDVPPRSTVTVVDIWPTSGNMRYSTFDVDTMLPLEVSELPPVIAFEGGLIHLSGRASGLSLGTP